MKIKDYIKANYPSRYAFCKDWGLKANSVKRMEEAKKPVKVQKNESGDLEIISVLAVKSN